MQKEEVAGLQKEEVAGLQEDKVAGLEGVPIFSEGTQGVKWIHVHNHFI